MIKVLIAGTNEVKELSMMYMGMDFVKDFIGSNGGWDQIEFNHEDGVFHTDSENFEWWEKVCADRMSLMIRTDDLEREYGKQAVMNAIAHVDYNDLEDETAAMNKALDEAFGTGVQ